MERRFVSKILLGFLLVVSMLATRCYKKKASLQVCNYNTGSDVSVLVNIANLGSNMTIILHDEDWTAHLVEDGKCRYLIDRYSECVDSWWRRQDSLFGDQFHLVLIILDTSKVKGIIQDSLLYGLKHRIIDTLLINKDSMRVLYPDCQLVL